MSKPKENDGQVVSRVPKLRFEGFDGDWEDKKLEDLSQTRLSNGVFNDPKKIGIYYKLINVSDMYISSCILDDNLSLVDISEKEFLKNKVEYGDIFFTRSSLVKSGIAYSNIYLGRSKNITFDCHLIKLKPNKEKVYPIFLNYILRTNYIRSQLVSRGKTATMTTIGQNDVAQVKLNLPSLPEQQKIAACLSSLDDLISAENQKLEALKNHKKGLMQKLFPQDGQTVPELRFEGFEGDWKEKKLGEVAKFFKGKGLPKSELDDLGSESCVHYGQLFTDYSEVINSIISRTKYQKDCFRSVKNDVLMPTSDVTPRGLAKASAIEFDDVILGGDILVIRTDPKQIYGAFLSRFIRSREQEVLKLVSGSTVFHLYSSSLEKFKILMPTFEEQQKIAACLSSLDDLITAQTGYINTLKQHKKGLMQQLFPSNSEA